MQKFMFCAAANILIFCSPSVAQSIPPKENQSGGESRDDNPYPPSSNMYLPFQQYLKALKNESKLVDALAKAKSKSEAKQIASSSSAKGLSKLSDGEMEEFFVLRTEVFRRLNPTMLAAIFLDTPDALKVRGKAGEALMKTLEKMDVKQIEQWFMLMTKAIHANYGTAQPKSASAKEVEVAMAHFYESISEDEREEFISIFGNMKEASTTDIYWAIQCLFTAIPTLQQPHKTVLIRAFLSE